MEEYASAEGSSETGGNAHHLLPLGPHPSSRVEVDASPSNGTSTAAPPTGVVAGLQVPTGGVGQFFPFQVGVTVTIVVHGAANSTELQVVR